jgi:hypothetical protein
MNSAKTVKEVLVAMVWMFENKLGHCKKMFFADSNGERLYMSEVGVGKVVPACADIEGCLYLVDADFDIKMAVISLIENDMDCRTKQYNDMDCRTKQDVLQLLKNAIDSIN